MPPVIPSRANRQVQALAAGHNLARALAQQQQGGAAGQPPGVATDPTVPPQIAHRTGVIQPYPATALSPAGDQLAGVGIVVLNNDGNPVVALGNLKATGGGVDLPASFADGGLAFIDAAGNLVAGYSQETGLWGFGVTQFYGRAALPWAVIGFTYPPLSDYGTTNSYVVPANGSPVPWHWSTPQFRLSGGNTGFADWGIYAPEFSAGTLNAQFSITVSDLELENIMILLTNDGVELTSGEYVGMPEMMLDVLDIIGSDLSFDGSTTHSARGGTYTTTFGVSFTSIGLMP